MESPAESLGDATRTIAPNPGAPNPGATPSGSTPPAKRSTPSLSSSSALADEGRFLPGTLLAGRYRIVGLLGKGGMGEVYRATDLTLAQSVALKFLPITATEDRFLLERFHGEVRIARQISHPNVCRVYDIGEAEGMPYISMEYVDGEDLSSLLPRIGRLPGDRAVAAARKICAGLAAAHSKGVIHRDLKPQNIMMDKRGEIVIMDFGLAAIADQLSGAEARNGTPAYMSPEQLKGTEVTARSDIYALGLVLYEIFTGRRPYEAKTIRELISLQESGQLTAISSVAADVDPAVEHIIRRCLDPDPAKRPETALAVSAALPGGDPLAAALAAGETPSPELVAASGETEGMERKYLWLCLATVMACLIAVPILKQKTDAFLQTPLDYTPEVLKQKARDQAVDFGYTKRPQDTALWLNDREKLIGWLDRLPAPRHFAQWLAAEAPATASYRESQSPMIAQPEGDVSESDPPFDKPGSVEVTVDFAGRLRGFEAVPYADSQTPAAPVPFEAVFHAAGFDPQKFSEVTPGTLPLVPTDVFRAWKGTHPGIPQLQVQLEAGWWKGRLTYVTIVWPWTKPAGAAASNNPTIEKVQSFLVPFLFGVGLLTASFFARRNWRQERADRHGAFVIGTTMFALSLLEWMARVHITASGSMADVGSNALFFAIAAGAIFFMLYLALEPAVRVRWPHALITWGRILEGRGRDAQVGSHILIGLALGGALGVMFMIREAIAASGEGLGTTTGLYYLTGVRYWMAGLLGRTYGAISAGLTFFFVIFGLRVSVRKDWVAAIVGGLAFAAIQGDLTNSANWQIDFVILSVVCIALTFALLRFGLLVTVTAVFAINGFNKIGVGTDWSAWYAPTNFASIAVLLAIAGIAFRYALGERELL